MKVLLISDSTMNVNLGGFAQTLYNIFSFVRPEDFLLITSKQSVKYNLPSTPYTQRVLTCDIELIPFQRNRFGIYINKFINWFNFSFHYQLNNFKRTRHAIKQFNADVIVVAPNGESGVLLYHLLKQAFLKKKVFPYFMDDWLFQSRLKWLGGNIHTLSKKLLAENTSWLMISEQLGHILSERYSIQPKCILSIHNPVNMVGIVPPKPVIRKANYCIAYAGALWQMHFDAFIVIAKAIALLQKEFSIKLVVYTDFSNWEWRKKDLENLPVEYGGHISYTHIHSVLREADCLLVTSSFTKEWETHSRGSVQTKITDYLKSGRLIIACGPTYAANHNFLKTHQCGICIETNDAHKAGGALQDILENIEQSHSFVLNGYKVLRNEFSFNVVHEKLHQFFTLE